MPATYRDFEAEVLAWMATCVTSRSSGAHREVELVRGNRSLEQLWRRLTPGQSGVSVVPRYTWQEFRVERISFSSPQASTTARTSTTRNGISVPPPALRGGSVTAGPPSAATTSMSRPDAGRPRPRSQRKAQVQPPIPNELDDMIADAGKLAGWLRTHGHLDDAGRLDRLIKRARSAAASVALLVGAYYIGVKYRAGKLLFLWGLRAAGARYQRDLGRLDRLLPDAEKILGDITDIAKKHHPATAGSGIDWKVLDQVVDPAVPAQLDDAACGPACVQIVLRDRGIEVSQTKLIRAARATIHPELKSKRVGPGALRSILRTLDPDGGWIGGQEVDDDFLQGKTPRQIVETLGERGAWVAQVGGHFVVVDGMDKAGYVRIRDPWYESGLARGIRAGTHYRVSLKTFFEHWLAVAVYRG